MIIKQRTKVINLNLIVLVEKTRLQNGYHILFVTASGYELEFSYTTKVERDKDFDICISKWRLKND